MLKVGPHRTNLRFVAEDVHDERQLLRHRPRAVGTKILRSITLASLALTAAPALAHADEVPPAALIGDFGLHVVGAGHHQTFNRYLAAQFLLDLYDPWTVNQHLVGPSNTPNADVLGAVVRARVFVHPFGQAPRGLWLSPFTQLGPVWATRAGVKRAGIAGATGVSIGYSIWIRDHVLIGLGAGAQYHAAVISGGDDSPSFAGLYPTVDILSGYAF